MPTWLEYQILPTVPRQPMMTLVSIARKPFALKHHLLLIPIHQNRRQVQPKITLLFLQISPNETANDKLIPIDLSVLPRAQTHIENASHTYLPEKRRIAPDSKHSRLDYLTPVLSLSIPYIRNIS